MARRNARSRSDSAAPSRGTKRARPKLENWQTPKPQPRPHTLPGQSQNRNWKTFGPKISDFPDFRSTFFFPKKRLNFGSAQNAPKSQKSDLGAFLAPILVAFWTPFGTNFLNISRFPENLYFATSPQRNAHFHLPNPLILGPNFNQILMFFGSRFRTPFFRHFSNMIPKNMIFGPPFGSSSAPNCAQNRPSGAKKLQNSSLWWCLFAFLNRPCFSLNHSNYAAVGPYWILKRRFWMKVCSISIFTCFFVYIHSHNFVHIFLIKQQ